MKLIKCQLCGADRVGPSTGRYPHGAPVTWGYHSGMGHPVVVKCMRCTGSFKVGPADFARMPTLRRDEEAALFGPLDT